MKKLSALLAIAAVLGAVCPADAQFVNPGSRSRPNPAFGGCTTYTTLPTLLNNQTGPIICDTKGSTFTVIRDAALNARGVNVTAGNALQADLTSIAGTATATSNGVVGAGVQRVAIASDNTAFSVNGTLSAETTKVIGTVRVLGNAGAIFDQATGSAVPANALYNGLNVAGNLRGLTGSNPTGSVFAAQTDLVGINGVTPLAGNGVTGTGSLRVTIASDTTANSNPYLVQPVPGTANGLTSFFLQPTASDNHTVVKVGAGVLYHVAVTNNSATINYLRFYNATTGFNGCNSATNLVYQLAIPGQTGGAGFVQNIDLGITFSTGISICVTSGYAQTDTTNATASAMSLLVGYK